VPSGGVSEDHPLDPAATAGLAARLRGRLKDADSLKRVDDVTDRSTGLSVNRLAASWISNRILLIAEGDAARNGQVTTHGKVTSNRCVIAHGQVIASDEIVVGDKSTREGLSSSETIRHQATAVAK
jgi:hypothetical protein